MESRFSVGNVVSRTFEVYFKNIVVLLAIGLVVYVPMSLVQSFITRNPDGGPRPEWFPLGVVTFGLSSLMAFIMQSAVVYGVYESLNGRRFDVGGSLRTALARLPLVVAVSIVATVLGMLGMVALVVPGIIVMCALWVAVPAVVVERKGVGASLSRSRQLTAGYRLRIFGIFVVLGIVSGLVGFVFAGIGGVMVAASGNSPLIEGLLDALSNALTGTLGAVGSGVGYYLLRMDVEGVDLAQLASVFD